MPFASPSRRLLGWLHGSYHVRRADRKKSAFELDDARVEAMSWWRKKPELAEWAYDVLVAISVYYGSSLVVFLGVSLGAAYFDRSHLAPSSDRSILASVAKWDGHWYREIVEEGYRFESNARSNSAFFPFYPLSAWLVRSATKLPTEAALLLTSNVSLAAAMVVFVRYLRIRAPVSVPSATEWAAAALGLFPTGCFFRMCYSESTFLLLAITAMYGMKRRWPPLLLVVVVGLATATRAVGPVLLVPLGIYLWQTAGTQREALRRLAIWLPLANSGILALMVFQYAKFGDALAFVHAQANWHLRSAVGWPATLASLATLEPVRAVYDSPSEIHWARFDAHAIPWFNLAFANPVFFVGAIGAILVGRWNRWLDAGETLFALGAIMVPYVARSPTMGMVGMGRFVAVAVPIYVVFGVFFARLPPSIAATLLGVAACFLGIYSALFAAAYPIV
jgi:hypothetical protein